MPVDYAEVLKDIETREGRLQAELMTLRAAKPAIAAMLKAQEAEAILAEPRGKYAGMGPTKAIQDVLSTGELLTREEIYEALMAGGWTTEAVHPLSNISASLSQMKDAAVEKVGDRWRRKNSRVAQALLDATVTMRPTDAERTWEESVLKASASVPAPPSVPWPSAQLGPEPEPSPSL